MKKKLQRFEEMKNFSHVIQVPYDEVYNKDHKFKGKWNKDIFKNTNPIILELGCGKGEYTTGLAEENPGKNFIGIDIKGARLWQGGKTALEKNLINVRFIRTRIEFIRSFFAQNEVCEIWITFPDPHEKRPKKRLNSPCFLNYYREFLIDKGMIHLKTDNKLLYFYNQAIIKENKLECFFATENLYSGTIKIGIPRIETFYEKLFIAEGKQITYQKFALPAHKVIKEVEFFNEKEYFNISQHCDNQ